MKRDSQESYNTYRRKEPERMTKCITNSKQQCSKFSMIELFI